MPHSARSHGHTFGEAFMLMRYACRDCGKNELIWNSRDGITPFGVGCSREDCDGTMNHIDWRGDLYAPAYKPSPGERFFRDGTPDEAAAIMQRRIDMTRDQYPVTPEYERELVEGARNAHATGDQNFHEFQKGWPTLDVWPGADRRE